ncbi:hypothetical protein [Pseudomonas putida]|nr:hypothetical protein [Pseudomonas putida]HDS0962996.1 hypothetical protein [Pseudomonas putida]HDS0990230.1 hypothetical protein [Pseudomonas putida]
MEALREEFTRAIEEAIEECHRIKYNPTTWERMNRQHGAVEAAVRLVTSGDFQAGLKKLLAENRPELTVEAHVLQPRFSALFDRRLIELAQWRLDNAHR